MTGLERIVCALAMQAADLIERDTSLSVDAADLARGAIRDTLLYMEQEAEPSAHSERLRQALAKLERSSIRRPKLIGAREPGEPSYEDLLAEARKLRLELAARASGGNQNG